MSGNHQNAVVEISQALTWPLHCRPGHVGVHRHVPESVLDEILPVSRLQLLAQCSEDHGAVCDVLKSQAAIATLLPDSELRALALTSPIPEPSILRFDFLPSPAGLRLTEITSIPAPMCLPSEATLRAFASTIPSQHQIIVLVLADRFRTADRPDLVSTYVDRTSSAPLARVCQSRSVRTYHYRQILDPAERVEMPHGLDVGVLVWADPRLLHEQPLVGRLVDNVIRDQGWYEVHGIAHAILVNNKALPVVLNPRAAQHWPRTTLLAEAADESVVSNRESVVLKRSLSCEGDHVHFGRDESPIEWKRRLRDVALDAGAQSYVVQDVLTPMRYRFRGEQVLRAIELYVYYTANLPSASTFAAVVRPLAGDLSTFGAATTEFWRFVEGP